MDALVSTAWLADHLGSPDLVVFDATKYLPNEGKDGAALFAEAHIPGARFFDIDRVADPETHLPHMVPSPGRFERLMGELGVATDSRVVFYDQKGIASSARGWWMMGLFGHDSVAVLDGGLPKWRAEGRLVMPSPPINRSKRPGLGTMCGRCVSGSATLSMSKKRAPGICASANNAAPSLPSLGRYLVASNTTRSGLPRWSASQVVETSASMI